MIDNLSQLNKEIKQLNDLAELNWMLCISALDDNIEALKEAREELEKAMEKLREL